MENYNFEVKLNMNIKSNDLNSALDILNEDHIHLRELYRQELLKRLND